MRAPPPTLLLLCALLLAAGRAAAQGESRSGDLGSRESLHPATVAPTLCAPRSRPPRSQNA